MRARVFLFALVLSTAPGCGACRRLAGEDTINLEKAEVRSMSVDIRRQQKTICPRAPVQMAIFADVALEGDNTAKPFETWQGRGSVNKNDKLDFAEFAFHSELGSFDREGWFTPNPNVLLTAGREFEIKSVYRRRPDKFSFTTSYKPDYACIKQGGGAGGGGHVGSAGGHGQPGKAGQMGSSSQAGGQGGDGGAGTTGGRGGDGGPGPYLRVFATMVKTPFYERLLAIAIEGDASDFLLVPDGAAVTIQATGGAGGAGGHGGGGGAGGAGGAGNPGGAGGKGGQGGAGGSGGNGGPGGAIELVVDARFTEIKAQVRLDVSGGAAGPAGSGGAPGPAGHGGSAISPSGASSHAPPPAQRGPDGSEGAGGASGSPGNRGSDGQAHVSTGDAESKIAAHAEVTPL